MSQTVVRKQSPADFKAQAIGRVIGRGHSWEKADQQLVIPYKILGKVHDNAAVEGFGGKLRTEPISRRTFKSRGPAGAEEAGGVHEGAGASKWRGGGGRERISKPAQH